MALKRLYSVKDKYRAAVEAAETAREAEKVEQKPKSKKRK